MQTLKDLAQSQGVSLQTAYNWISRFEQHHGKGSFTNQGRRHPTDQRKVIYFPDAIATLLRFNGITEPEPEPALMVEMVNMGNHCTALALPTFEGMQIDLAQFRNSSALVIEDPLAAAQQFLAVADTVIDALDQDAAAREARLKQTRQAREAVTAKAQEMQLEQRLYRERARAADVAQSTEAKALADALAALQGLGKPAAPAGGDGQL